MSNPGCLSDIPEDPLFVTEIIDQQHDLEGWVAVHSFGKHGACGGIRLYPDVSRREVEILAKGMSYKYSFHEISLGGAKAGLKIPFDISADERKEKLKIFGRHIGPLIRNKIYHPWTDMNCSNEDLANIYAGAGKKYYPPTGDSSYYTALSTFSGVFAASKKLSVAIEDCRIVIQGLGNVGKYLAKEIKSVNAKLTAASTRMGGAYNRDGLDIDRVLSDIDKHGDNWVNQDGPWQKIPVEQIFDIEMDLLIPSARTLSVTEEIAEKINCRAVVPAANSPCTQKAIDIFHKRNIILLPFFITNSGGVTGPGLENLGDSDQNIREIYYQHFTGMLERLFIQAERENMTLIATAKKECARNFHKNFRIPIEKKPILQRVFKKIKRHLFDNKTKKLKKIKTKMITTLDYKFS